VLAIADTGIGLASDAVDRVFESFYTTKTHGMGIGLAISRSIIESHLGRLWTDKNEGPGVTFSFSLPCLSGDKTSVRGLDPAQTAGVADSRENQNNE
jgi:signal transduction histidine kinase